MQIYVSISSKRSPEQAATFVWPSEVPLVVPREGELAVFSGQEPRLVRRVTSIYEGKPQLDPEQVKLTVHIETA
jgi:hypothetical protein